MRRWRTYHNGSFWRRGPLKLFVFVVGLLLVLFPRVDRIAPWAYRLSAMDRLIDPDAPELAPLEERIRAKLPPGTSARDALPIVNRVVREAIPYTWDWDRWGNADYWPTVAEALTGPGEDCDGRAVVAASLLRRLGFEAWLVSDLLHVWVGTPEGETMEPTSARRTFVGGAPGTQGTVATVNLDVLTNAIRGLAYGISVFPTARVVLIVVVAAALTLHPWVGWPRTTLSLLLFGGGVALLCVVGEQAAMRGAPRDVALAAGGALMTGAGWVLLAVKAAGRRPRSSPAQPE